MLFISLHRITCTFKTKESETNEQRNKKNLYDHQHSMMDAIHTFRWIYIHHIEPNLLCKYSVIAFNNTPLFSFLLRSVFYFHFHFSKRKKKKFPATCLLHAINDIIILLFLFFFLLLFRTFFSVSVSKIHICNCSTPG